jgi:signal transduction histidine kinase
VCFFHLLGLLSFKVPTHSKQQKAQGTGIGLFHSKKIIEAHQGRIEVESEEGKGSTFRVLLSLKIEHKG